MMESKWGEVTGREKGRESGAHKSILLIIYEDGHFVCWFENEGQFVDSPQIMTSQKMLWERTKRA